MLSFIYPETLLLIVSTTRISKHVFMHHFEFSKQDRKFHISPYRFFVCMNVDESLYTCNFNLKSGVCYICSMTRIIILEGGKEEKIIRRKW